MLDDNRTDVPADQLGPLVAKYSNIFLEVRWVFPRRYDQLSHYAWLLSDPGADELDTVELAHLSRELQTRLFGTGLEDAVKLVLFEGDDEAIETFSAWPAETVLDALQNPDGLPPGCRLRRIAPDGSLSGPEETGETPGEPDTPNLFKFAPTIDTAQGVYFPPGRQFVGDVLSCTPVSAPTYYSLLDGADHRPEDTEAFDAACVTTALRFLVDFPSLPRLFVPISFSTLVRPSQRAAYLDLIMVLPPIFRSRLSASVYDVPRSPTFQALKTLREMLDPHFGAIGLGTHDPDFQIEQLAERAVHSVTFTLPDAHPDVRLAALRRFASHTPHYRKRCIASGVTNIRFRTERELAIELKV
ncbi:MAG TPA: hypothetical protein VF633_03560, partial [Brevundimonas sp.]